MHLHRFAISTAIAVVAIATSLNGNRLEAQDADKKTKEPVLRVAKKGEDRAATKPAG